ncbi:endonuclease III domain-containing protein [Patescibacteria group bacterium]
MNAPKDVDKVFRVFRAHYVPIPLEVFKSPYEIFVSTLLSSRTNDDTTLIVCKKLFGVVPDIQKLSTINADRLAKLIYPVGFYKTKAKNLKMSSEIIIDRFNGKIPRKRSDLLGLPGVGIKTANLVLNRAFDISAISVDTHVHRITNLLGWVNTKTPEKTLIELENILPQKYWKDTNRLFVSIGRQYTSKKKLVEFLKENKLI